MRVARAYLLVKEKEKKGGRIITLGGRMASRSASEACGNLSLAVLLSFFLSAPDKRCMVFTSAGFLNMADQTQEQAELHINKLICHPNHKEDHDI